MTIIPWSEKELFLLDQNKNETYERLMGLLPGRTKRMIKRKVSLQGLIREERRRWSEGELRVLGSHPEFAAKDFQLLLPGRALVQIAYRLRRVRKTARRSFKQGWAVPSAEFAYVLGMWCSDGIVTDYSLEFSQHEANKEALERVEKAVGSIFGMVSGGEERGIYKRIWFCSREFKRAFHSKPEWIDLLDSQY